MKNLLSLLLLFLSFSSIAQTIRATATAEVESGNMRFIIRNDGSLFHKNGELGQFTGPKNEEGEKPPLLDFAGLWLGSIHEGEYKVSIADNRNIDTTHFAPGPSYSPSGTLSLDKQEIFNQIWQVTDEEVVAHIADFVWDGKVDTIRETIYQWPGFGNKHFQELFENTEENEVEERYLVRAPFADLNENERYEPHLGEYPYPDLPYYYKIKRPSQIYYTVFNDYNATNPMKINMHQTVYTFECDSPSMLNNTIFVNYEYVNKSENSIDSLYLACFLDSALSCSEKNFAGTDTLTSALYLYNGQDYDTSVDNEECTDEDFPFTQNAPIVSTLNLNKYSVNSWAFTTSYNTIPSLSPGAQTPPQGSPIEYYRYLTGRWRDGTPFTYGGNGYGGNEATRYIYPGNPETQEGWTMRTDDLHYNVPERFFFASAEAWSHVNDGEWGNPIYEYGSLLPDRYGKTTFALTIYHDDTENMLTNAQSARDSLYEWFYLTGIEEFDEGVNPITLGNNCITSQPRPPLPIKPVVPLYPNPAQDFITIRLAQKEMNFIKIYNISGQLTLEQEVVYSFDNAEFIMETKLDVSTLPTGLYIAQIRGSDNEIQIHKFLKM